MKLFRWIVPLMLALASLVPAGMANGQETPSPFPNRLIKIIVPYPPGGGVDGLARPIAERLSRLWGQSVIIENKPGAATMIGGAEVAHAPADGHTLLFTSDSSITSNPHLFKKMSFDPIKELAPVTQLIELHQFVLVHPAVSANTIKDLVALAKEKPDALNYGSYGKGSQPHLLFEMLREQTGARIQQISYRGIAPAITAVLTGEVQTTLGSVAVAAGHIEAGKLKALAIGRPARLSTHPEIPTLQEAGFPDIEPLSWFGLFAPAETPPAIVEKIQQAVASLINEPEFKARFIDQAGHTGVGSTPSAFAAYIQADLAAKRKMIAAAGIEPE
jgi:tripartite-type tricarboxylate transporter receptor subunit TctC